MPLKLFRSTEFKSSFLPHSARSGGLHPASMLVLASVWLATLCNVALWRTLARLPEMDTLHGLWFGCGFALLIAAATCAVLSLFAWRWTLKPVVSLFLLAAAFAAHYMLAYGVVIDTPMIINVLQTNPAEVRDLLSWRLAATVFALAVLPMAWLWRVRVRRVPALHLIWQNALLLIASCALLTGTLLVIYQDFASLMRNQVQVRYLINPLNALYALADLAAKPLQLNTSVIEPIGLDARLGTGAGNGSKPPLVVLVLGETARAGNFALNGYARPTTPRLAAENVASFRNAWSCGSSTASSVPCMFAHLDHDDFDRRKANYENLVDVLQHAGLAVLWIDNQSGCKGICARVPNITTSSLNLPGLCQKDEDGIECFDEIMLHNLDARIAALPAERRAKGVVVVMHQMGGHGPAYYRRAPQDFKKFLPECTSNSLQQCDRALVVNAYDNTIVYTDHFLYEVLQWLKTRESRTPAAMLYVADHGESLGENNIYLHGLPYAIAPDVQKRVPWISWFSPEFEQLRGVTTKCLKQRLDEQLSHDNYFHSVLGLLDVQTKLYEPGMDMFRPCTTAAK